MRRSAFVLLLLLTTSPTASAAPIALPDSSTVAGAVARLLLAESLTPATKAYDEAQVKRGMQAMKAALSNRLSHNPAQFGAPKATSVLDILTAPGQFAGFSRDAKGALVIDKAVQDRLNDILKKANTGKPGKYYQLVQNANEVAAAPANDPWAKLTTVGKIKVVGGTFGWRRAGSGSPGGSFVAIPGGLLGGNQFYTIKSPKK
jgi:hypothetical protein